MAKKNNNILLISVFVLLIIVYYLTSPSSSSSSMDKVFLEVDKEAVTKIEIVKAGNTISLEKGSNQWLVDNYKVDEMAIDAILSNLELIEISRLVTDKESKFPLYQVDDKTGIKVTVYADETNTFYIGKTGSSSNSILIRKDGENKVYASRKNFRSYFEKSVLDLKDKNIVSIPRENIASLIIENMGKKLFIMNLDSATMISGENVESEPQVAGSWMVNSLLTKLNSLNASDFSEKKMIEDIPQTISISISKRDGSEVKIMLHPKDETDYYVSTSLSDVVFISSKANFSSFEKPYEELKEK